MMVRAVWGVVMGVLCAQAAAQNSTSSSSAPETLSPTADVFFGRTRAELEVGGEAVMLGFVPGDAFLALLEEGRLSAAVARARAGVAAVGASLRNKNFIVDEVRGADGTSYKFTLAQNQACAVGQCWSSSAGRGARALAGGDEAWEMRALVIGDTAEDTLRFREDVQRVDPDEAPGNLMHVGALNRPRGPAPPASDGAGLSTAAVVGIASAAVLAGLVAGVVASKRRGGAEAVFSDVDTDDEMSAGSLLDYSPLRVAGQKADPLDWGMDSAAKPKEQQCQSPCGHSV